MSGAHPNPRGDLYTPITPEFMGLLDRMRAECGSWRLVAAKCNMRMKTLRRIRKRAGSGPEQRAISLTTVDKMCIATGVGSSAEFIWFTADDLVTLGIWKQPVSIEKQVVKVKTREEKHTARLERARERRRAARRKRLGYPE